MHHFHLGMLPPTYNRLFTRVSNIHSYSTQGAAQGKYFWPSVNNELDKKSLQYSGPKFWSSIDPSILDLPPYGFKRNLKSTLIEKYTSWRGVLFILSFPYFFDSCFLCCPLLLCMLCAVCFLPHPILHSPCVMPSVFFLSILVAAVGVLVQAPTMVILTSTCNAFSTCSKHHGQTSDHFERSLCCSQQQEAMTAIASQWPLDFALLLS